MGEIVSFDGVVLHYEEEGDGPPVVLLHGLSSSTAGNWVDPGIWSELVAAGRRVIGLDARGHGLSEKPHDPSAYGGDAMVRDTGALFDALGLEGVCLAGYSMGASTALQFAASDGRLQRLVLGGIGGDPSRWSTEADGRVPLSKRWLAGVEAENPDDIEDPVARRAREVFAARGNDLAAIAALLRADRRHLSSDMPVTAIEVPTLVVCGDKDASPQPLAAALSRGEAVILEGDHSSVVANPDLAKTIVAFVTAAAS